MHPILSRLSFATTLWAMRASGPSMYAATQSTAQALPCARDATDGPCSWRWNEGSGRKNSWEGLLDGVSHAEKTREEVEVHVATDSAVQGKCVVFATVVCVIAKGKAGRYYYSRQVEHRHQYPVLQTRLLREVELSLNTAEALTENDVAVQMVHCDSNTDPGCKSTEHTRMLVGYIQSMGYAYSVKPEAWATFVADRHSRGLTSRRSRLLQPDLLPSGVHATRQSDRHFRP